MIHYAKKQQINPATKIDFEFAFLEREEISGKNQTVMSSSCSHSQESNSQVRRPSMSSIESDEEEDEYINDDDSNDPSLESTEKTSTARNKNKKTLGRVKIKMAYIDNKIRRYTTFSKRKTGIMKKAYELATLTGTEVMLLVASETGKIS